MLQQSFRDSIFTQLYNETKRIHVRESLVRSFSTATDAKVEQFTESISFDQRLYAHDIMGSIAHAQMLTKVGMLTADECRQIENGLAEIKAEIEQGKFTYTIELEDIHLHIERALIERIGDVGRKLHTARSRNDQVSTDLRLWCRWAVDEIDARLVTLQKSFLSLCRRDQDAILPGYTHLQRAQPVLAAHYWLAYCEKFEPRSPTIGRLPQANQSAQSWCCGTGRNQLADRSI